MYAAPAGAATGIQFSYLLQAIVSGGVPFMFERWTAAAGRQWARRRSGAKKAVTACVRSLRLLLNCIRSDFP
jgi:hypothetical protein